MKLHTLFSLTVCLLLACQSRPGENQSEPESPRQLVVHFINWYKENYEKVNAIPLVTQGVGKNYSVNFSATEEYLNTLKSSGLVSDGFIDEWRKYFAEAEENFKNDPVNEGPPPGFDYDLLLLTQEPDLVLNDSLPQFLSENSEDDVVVLQIDFDGMGLEFTLVNQDGRWLIDKIGPLEG